MLHVLCDPMISAHPLCMILSARSSYYCNNVYISILCIRSICGYDGSYLSSLDSHVRELGDMYIYLVFLR